MLKQMIERSVQMEYYKKKKPDEVINFHYGNDLEIIVKKDEKIIKKIKNKGEEM